MIEISVQGDVPIHCMICGIQTTNSQGLVRKCPHLVYVGHRDGVEFSIYQGSVKKCPHLVYVGPGNIAEFSIYADVEETDDDELDQYTEQLKIFRKILDDEHLSIHVGVPAPSFETYSIIYNFQNVRKST